MKAAFASAVFGGSIFDGIKGATAGQGDGTKEKRHDGKKVHKRNNLRQDILQATGELHIFKNVIKNQNTYCDIYMLIHTQQLKSLKQFMLRRPKQI